MPAGYLNETRPRGDLVEACGLPARRMRMTILALALIACAALFAASGANNDVSVPRRTYAIAARAPAPALLIPALSASTGASGPLFAARRAGGALLTAGGGVGGAFDAAGVSLRAAGGVLVIASSEIARAGRSVRLASAVPTASADRVEYRRGALVETYVNGPLGLEQGFVVGRRPVAGSGAVELRMRLGGSLVPVRASARQILFARPGGGATLSYSRLAVFDATGRRLPASMSVHGGELRLSFEDGGARYPVRVDPFIGQGGALVPGGESGAGEFGAGAALSADGNTAIVGAPGDAGGVGAAWVFTRTGAGWEQQGQKLVGGSEAGAGRFGASVALSADGSVALIGGPRDAEGTGAAWVFERTGSSFSQQGSKLTGAGESGPGGFGTSVALSGDGATALAGAPRDEPAAQLPTGAVWAFARAGEGFAPQSGKILGEGEIGPGHFGESLALSYDGSTAAVGAPTNEYCFGGVWVLARSGTAWSRQALFRGDIQGTACDDGPDEGASDENRFGQAVAISADGNTVLASEPYIDVLRPGETLAYARSGSSWGGRRELTDPTGRKAGASTIGLSADGTRALLGKAQPEGGSAAFAFLRPGSEWDQEGAAALGAGEGPTSVALSADGTTALTGAPAQVGGSGQAFAFARSARGAAPVLAGESAGAVGQATATLHGTLDAQGAELYGCLFEYGPTTAYGSVAPCSPLPSYSTGAVAISAGAAGLLANTSYHFRAVAAGPGGIALGQDESFATLPGPPALLTGAADSISLDGARLRASVNPLGQGVDTCRFEYGPTAAYGSSVPCAALPGSGRDPVEVTAAVSALAEFRTYHFRIVAGNASGTGYGADATFATLSGAPDIGTCVAAAAGAGSWANGSCTKTGSAAHYAWRPLASAVPFAVAGGAVVLETVGHVRVTCLAAAGSGRYTGRWTLGGILLRLSGCESAGAACTSALAVEGEVASAPLGGLLGVAQLGKSRLANKIGVELAPSAGSGPLMEFVCGITPFVVRGAAIAALTADRPLAAEPIRLTASKGRQAPERLLGDPRATLEVSSAGGGFEQAGLSVSATATGEAVEVNSVA